MWSLRRAAPLGLQKIGLCIIIGFKKSVGYAVIWHTADIILPLHGGNEQQT